MRSEHLSYEALQPFVDVLTGAVYGYGAYEVANALTPLLTDPPTSPDWGRVLLLAFVAHYLTADSIECRIYNAKFPYVGRFRFLVDVTISASFFLAFMAAAAGSVAVLLTMGIVFALGAVWSVALEFETRHRVRWGWPRMLVLSHSGAAIGTLVGYGLLFRNGVHHMDVTAAAQLWGFYGVWALGVVLVRRLMQIPAAEAELLPVGLVVSGGWAVARGITSCYRFITGNAVKDAD